MNGDQQRNQPGSQAGAPPGNLPTGDGERGQSFNAPPPSEVNIRTLSSDTKSIGRGDAVPVPESVMPPESSTEPVFKPETQFSQFPPKPMGDMGLGAAEPKRGRMWVWIIGAILVVGIGAGGYFAFPILFPSEAPPLPPPPPAPVVSVVPHRSLFSPSPFEQTEIRLATLSASGALNSLQTLAATGQPSGTLQEVAIMDSRGSQIPFGAYLNAFAPALGASQLQSWFEDDFTAFLYYDENGAWPGYIARVKNGVDLNAVKSSMTAIEGSDLSGFYLAPPGVFGQFKDGQVNGKATRYAVGSQKGAALNYGLVGNYFVISASYSGLQASAPLLGL